MPWLFQSAQRRVPLLSPTSNLLSYQQKLRLFFLQCRHRERIEILQIRDFAYFSFFKCVVDKSKNEIPNNKNVMAGAVFLSIKFSIDTIKKHIEASKKHINLIFSFFIIPNPYPFKFPKADGLFSSIAPTVGQVSSFGQSPQVANLFCRAHFRIPHRLSQNTVFAPFMRQTMQ